MKNKTKTETKKPLTLKALGKELDKLKKTTTERHKYMKLRFANISKSLNATVGRLDNIQPQTIETELQRLRPRVSSMNAIVQAMVNKTTVITETCYFVRVSKPDLYEKYCSICIWAYDALPDEWWKDSTRVIGEWTDLIVMAWTRKDDATFEKWVALLGNPETDDETL